ncbi:RRM domain-containing protein [Plasmodiophora brassicae]
MAHYMPPHMLALFAPRPPLPYQEPLEPKRGRPLTGLAAFKSSFQDPATLPPLVKHETAPEKRARRAKKQAAKTAARIASQAKRWNPQENPNATEDAYKTLFITRLDYNVTEDQLKKELSNCGPVKSVHIVKDQKTSKPRGYAFVEFEHEKDLKHAYKAMDGKKLLNRRVTVDVERGRTVPNWKPRRLGGGLGSTRKTKEKKQKGAGAPAPLRREESRGQERSARSGGYESRSGYRPEHGRGGEGRGYSDRGPGRSDDRYRDGRDRDRHRDYERDRDRSRGHSYRDDKPSYRRSSHEDDDRSRRDDRRSSHGDDRRNSSSYGGADRRPPSSGLPSNGPPLPPQSQIFG